MIDPSAAVRPWIIAIGASGDVGLRNILQLLTALGRLPNAVVMVVLHRPFHQPSQLRQVIETAIGLPVFVAETGERLEAGSCYIGEPAAHLTLLTSTYGGITPDHAGAFRNRTVDLLLTSVARHAGNYGIGVVLSGSLDDGSRGMEAIHAAGGTTMALLRDVTVPGMPENAIAYDGPVDCIGSIDEIAHAIIAAVSMSGPARLEAAEQKAVRH